MKDRAGTEMYQFQFANIFLPFYVDKTLFNNDFLEIFKNFLK